MTTEPDDLDPVCSIHRDTPAWGSLPCERCAPTQGDEPMTTRTPAAMRPDQWATWGPPVDGRVEVERGEA